MQYSSSYTQQILKPIQQNLSFQTNTTGIVLEGILVVSLVCNLTLGIFLYKRYRAYRTATLKLQVAALERLWKISPEK